MGTSKKALARGIRSNNPGNLVKTSIKWKGKIPHDQNTDSRYEAFTAPHWGIRAMTMDIRNDIEKDGTNTIRKLINEYAPRFENPTANYIAHVAKSVGIDPDTVIKKEHYPALIKALIFFENGEQPYGEFQILSAINDSYNQY